MGARSASGPAEVLPTPTPTAANRTIANRQVAAATGAPVIDLHKLSYTLYNSLKLCPNNGDYVQGAVGAFFCNDHAHFEAAGADRIARVVAKALRDQRIPLSSYLK